MKLGEMLKKAQSHQFSRFLLVGVVNTFFGYAIFVLLLYIGLHYSVAAFISVAIGAIFNFQTTGHFVFGTRNRIFLLKFMMVYLVIYITKVLGLFMLLKVGINSYVGGALLILPLAALSFVLNKNWAFKT